MYVSPDGTTPPATNQTESDMTTINVSAPAAVSIRVQGFATEIDLTQIPAESLAAMVAYGVRRKYQDSINSAAKEARDAGESIDGAALFNAFHARVLDAALGVRGESITADPLDKYRRAIVRDLLAKDKAGAGWKGYAAIDSADRKARDAYLLGIAQKNAAKIDPVAQAMLERDRADAKAVAGLDL